MPTVNLQWKDTNQIEKGYNIYRSETPFEEPIDSSKLIGSVSTNVNQYTDEDETLILGNTYYYVVSAFIDADEQFSSPIEYIVAQNVIYVSSSDRVIKYDEGDEIWIYNSDGTSIVDIFHLPQNEIVIYYENTINILNSESGDLKESISFINDIVHLSISEDHNYLSVLLNDSTYYVIDILTLNVETVLASAGNNDKFLVTNDGIYRLQSSGTLTQYEFDGSSSWEITLDISSNNDFKHYQNSLYIASDNTILVLDDSDGTEVNSFTHPSDATFTEIIIAYNGRILTRSNNDVISLNSEFEILFQSSSGVYDDIDGNINGKLFTIEGDIVKTVENKELVSVIDDSANVPSSISTDRREETPDLYIIEYKAGIVQLDKSVSGTVPYDNINLNGDVIAIKGININNEMNYTFNGDLLAHDASLTIQNISFNNNMNYTYDGQTI